MRSLRVFGVLLTVLSPALAALAQAPASGGDEGPVDGLTLDAAIEILIADNSNLRARSREIPEARADELTAGLRNSPALFLFGDQLPYGRYSEERPGAAEYEVSPAQNVDYSGKRRAHMRHTALATRQVEARYQNSVREEIDRLYDAFVAVLEARETLRAGHAQLERLRSLANQVKQKNRPETEQAACAVHRFNAETAVEEGQSRLLEARRQLAARLAIPAERADGMVVHGSLHDHCAPPPPAKELYGLATGARPDLAAQRLAVATEQAGVSVARAEVFDDAILFASPYEVQNFRPEGKRPATDWGAGGGTTLPIFDRNQGDIARARRTVQQTEIELRGLERRIVNEVEKARADYDASREVVQHYEKEGLPAITRLRDEKLSRYAAGTEELDSVLDILQLHHEEMGNYLEALASHRRAMLRMNTAVGQRLLP